MTLTDYIETNMTTHELLDIIKTGCKFEYKSYDHKKAVEIYKETPQYIKHQSEFKEVPNCFYMPDEIKEQTAVWKVGKVRSIKFSPIGKIQTVKIGNRYSKTFYLSDFGVTVKPIL